MAELNEDQLEVLEFVKNGKNVFVTGGAGVGKSFLLKEITNYFRENSMIFAVTAMTGSAAILINGRTLHSTLGIGLGKGTPNELLKRLFKMEGPYSLLMSLEVLIIDEVSMLNDILFDKIFELLKLVKRNNKPFGGIQVILVGDMSQLPPVEGSFCFKSFNFDFNVKILTKNMRVQNDNLFENILGRLRWGICTDDDYTILESLRETTFENDIVPTKLYSTNKDVDSVNTIELQNLINKGVEYKMYSIRYTSNPLKLKASTNYVNSQKIQEHVKLCIGAQVMVNRNLDSENQIVNGTRGVVTHLYDDYIVIKLINGNEQIISYFHVKPDPFDTILVDKNLDFKYLPIQLAWSVSIHKSQGMTIDALSADLGRSVFAFGQAYTAISRAKNLSSIKLTKVSQRSFRASPDVIEFYSKYS